MGESVKLAARKRALQQRTEMRSQRVQRDRRLDDAALALLLALAERDAAVEDSERRASEALRTMSDEGLSLRDAVAWAGNKITFREAARLRRLVGDCHEPRGTVGRSNRDRLDNSAASADHAAMTTPTK